MILGKITDQGLRAINNAISSNGVFLTLSEAKLNNSIAPLPKDNLTDLPLPSISGYVNSVTYDQANQGLIIQCIFDTPAPVFQYNSCGVYDNKGNLLFYSIEHVPMTYSSSTTLRYYFFIPLYKDLDTFDNVRIILPQNKVVHHVYEFSVESVYWKAQHNLLTPFIQFTVYDINGQVIKEDQYEAYVTPGALHIVFKEKRQGYISLQGEGYSISTIQGEINLDDLQNSAATDYESATYDDIPWLYGTLLSWENKKQILFSLFFFEQLLKGFIQWFTKAIALVNV